jgi:hypothetical protein
MNNMRQYIRGVAWLLPITPSSSIHTTPTSSSSIKICDYRLNSKPSYGGKYIQLIILLYYLSQSNSMESSVWKSKTIYSILIGHEFTPMNEQYLQTISITSLTHSSSYDLTHQILLQTPVNLKNNVSTSNCSNLLPN